MNDHASQPRGDVDSDAPISTALTDRLTQISEHDLGAHTRELAPYLAAISLAIRELEHEVHSLKERRAEP